MYRIRLLLYILLILLTFSCVKKIDLDLPVESVNEVTIQAKLISGKEKIIEVNTYKVYDRTGDSYDRVNSRSMFLEAEDGSQIEIPLKSSGLNYLKIDTTLFPINAGKKYRLRAFFAETGQVVSEWETIPEPIVNATYSVSSGIKFIKNTRFNVFKKRHVVRISLDELGFQPDGTSVGLKYDVEYVFKFKNFLSGQQEEFPYCYLREVDYNRTDVNLIERVFDNQSYDNYVVIETNANHRFDYGCYVVIRNEALSDKGYEYFRQIKLLNPEKGSLFQRKAGNIRSSFKSDNDLYIHGNFYATAPSITRVYVTPEMANAERPLCPLFLPPPMYGYPHTLCQFCSNEPNATTTKPDFWVD